MRRCGARDSFGPGNGKLLNGMADLPQKGRPHQTDRDVLRKRLGGDTYHQRGYGWAPILSHEEMCPVVARRDHGPIRFLGLLKGIQQVHRAEDVFGLQIVSIDNHAVQVLSREVGQDLPFIDITFSLCSSLIVFALSSHRNSPL
jgi:hypothetical protein